MFYAGCNKFSTQQLGYHNAHLNNSTHMAKNIKSKGTCTFIIFSVFIPRGVASSLFPNLLFWFSLVFALKFICGSTKFLSFKHSIDLEIKLNALFHKL